MTRRTKDRAARYGRRKATPNSGPASGDSSVKPAVTENTNEIDEKEIQTMPEVENTPTTETPSLSGQFPASGEARDISELPPPILAAVENGVMLTCHSVDPRTLLAYLWAETDRASSEVADPSKETGKSLGQLDALRAVTRQVTKMALGMTE